jgi:hypothetical protein
MDMSQYIYLVDPEQLPQLCNKHKGFHLCKMLLDDVSGVLYKMASNCLMFVIGPHLDHTCELVNETCHPLLVPYSWGRSAVDDFTKLQQPFAVLVGQTGQLQLSAILLQQPFAVLSPACRKEAAGSIMTSAQSHALLPAAGAPVIP